MTTCLCRKIENPITFITKTDSMDVGSNLMGSKDLGDPDEIKPGE